MARGSSCQISISDALLSTATTGQLPRVRGMACYAHVPSAYFYPPGHRARTDRAGLHRQSAFWLTSPDPALPRVKCALACGYGMQLHDGLPRRHLGVTGPPGGMPDDRQRPRSGGGACASHCTKSPGRPLSCPVESPHALAERETLFSCRMPPRNPKGRGVPVQKIDVFAIFNLFGVSGQKLKLFGDRRVVMAYR